MRVSKALKEKQRAYAQQLLASLGRQLASRGIEAELVTDQEERPRLEVADCRRRVRRVYAHLPFCWFYWGDQPDERVSFLNMDTAVNRVEEAARQGWHEGEQGELTIDFSKIAAAYRD